MFNSNTSIYVAGHRGMVGSAIIRKLEALGHSNILTQSHSQLDLTNQSQVADFMHQKKPGHIILAAAKVGGIHANNTYPADFIYENLMIEANIIHQAFSAGVKSLLFLGSSCIYPKLATQPIHENALLTNTLEPTNEPYAIAKIAGIKLCESYNRQYGTDYRSAMPTNLYGINDNFHPENSHVIPALLRKFHLAKTNNAPSVEIWGSGKAMREFLHVDDMASACLHIMQLSKEKYASVTTEMLSHINVGASQDISIKHLAEIIADVTNYNGELVFNTSQPDGTPKKLMDSSKLSKLGWGPTIELREGLSITYEWFIANQNKFRS